MHLDLHLLIIIWTKSYFNLFWINIKIRTIQSYCIFLLQLQIIKINIKNSISHIKIHSDTSKLTITKLRALKD